MIETENKIDPQEQVINRYDFSAWSLTFYLYLNLLLVAIIFIWFGNNGYTYFVLACFATLATASYLQARRPNKTKIGFNTYVLIFWLLVGLIPAILVGIAMVRGDDIGMGVLAILFTPAIWLYTSIIYVVTKATAAMSFSNINFDRRVAILLSISAFGVVTFFSYTSPHCSEGMICDKLWSLRDPQKYCSDFEQSYHSSQDYNECITLQAVLREKSEICNLVTDDLSTKRNDWTQRCQKLVLYHMDRDKSDMVSYWFVPENFSECEMLGHPVTETDPKTCEYEYGGGTIFQQ
jgi:hypothetical protein